jgi:hypothetical protein
MVFLSLGLPGCFTEWCGAVVFQLVKRALGSAELTTASTLDELAFAMLRTEASHLVVGSREPGGRLRKALAEANTPFIVSLDDPRVALADLVVRGGLDFVSGTRAVASSCATMLDYVSMPRALVLTERDGRDPFATAEAIAHHFGIVLGVPGIADIVDALADTGIIAERSDEGVWWKGCDEAEQALVNGALGAYADHFAGGNLGPITWTKELFLIGDPPNDRATRAVDVTGRARCLIFGPYIMLPSGSWSATVVLGFSKEAAESSYVVEIFAGTHLGTHLTRTTLRPVEEGVFEVNLAFSIEEPTEDHVQVRIFNERASFDGLLAMGQVTFARQTRSRSERLPDLTSVLSMDQRFG